MVSACGQGPKHIDEVKDAEVSPLSSNSGKNFLRGALSLKGKELVPCKFAYIEYAGNGFFKVRTPKDRNDDDFWGLYKDGKQIIPCEYNSLAVSGSTNGAAACIDKGSMHIWYAFDLTDGVSRTDKDSFGQRVELSVLNYT